MPESASEESFPVSVNVLGVRDRESPTLVALRTDKAKYAPNELVTFTMTVAGPARLKACTTSSGSEERECSGIYLTAASTSTTSIVYVSAISAKLISAQ